MSKIIIVFISIFFIFNVEAKSLEKCADESIKFTEQFHNDVNFGKNIESIILRYYGEEIKSDIENYYSIKHFLTDMKYQLFFLDEIAVFECKNNLSFMVPYYSEYDSIYFRFYTATFDGAIKMIESIHTHRDLEGEASLKSMSIGKKYKIFKPNRLFMPEVIRSCFKIERPKKPNATFTELMQLCEKSLKEEK